MKNVKVAGIIPARWGSTRLPGKPLCTICGRPMIQRVYERCLEAQALDVLCVATDDARILEAVEGFGGRAVMTAIDHPSGTDRLAEAVQLLEADIVVNIQGDQPFMDSIMIDEAVQPLLVDDSVQVCTLIHPVEKPEDLTDPAVVKTVVDLAGYALYFTRSLVPYPQKDVPHKVYEHVWLYVYRRDFLLTVSKLEPTPLEQVESLEQLRWLEHGHRIRVVETQCADNAFGGFSVDTPEDVERAEAMLRERGLP